MIEGLPWQGWLGIVGTCVALLAWFVVSIGRGNLIPRTVHERELDAAAEALQRSREDTMEWRAEGRLKDQQIAQKDEQLAEKDRQLTEKDRQLRYLGEVGETQKAVLSALQKMAAGEVNQP